MTKKSPPSPPMPHTAAQHLTPPPPTPPHRSLKRHHKQQHENDGDGVTFCTNPACEINPPPKPSPLADQLVDALQAQLALMTRNLRLQDEVRRYQSALRRMSRASLFLQQAGEADLVQEMLQHFKDLCAPPLPPPSPPLPTPPPLRTCLTLRSYPQELREAAASLDKIEDSGAVARAAAADGAGVESVPTPPGIRMSTLSADLVIEAAAEATDANFFAAYPAKVAAKVAAEAEALEKKAAERKVAKSIYGKQRYAAKKIAAASQANPVVSSTLLNPD